jgi:hypothetical protein
MRLERREARLRPEFADLYQGVPADQWRPINELLDRVKAARLLGGRRSGELLSTRPLDDRHFDFRGGSIRPAERGAQHSRATDLR